MEFATLNDQALCSVPSSKSSRKQASECGSDATTECGSDATNAAATQRAEVFQAPVGMVLPAGPEFVHGLGIVLSGLVQVAATTPGRPHKVARFHSVRAPGMLIADYLKRIRKLFLCSDECFVLALVYIDRVGKTDASAEVCDLTVHRLVAAAVMLAAKFHDDMYYSNAHYAKASGLSLKEVNVLEKEMLKLLGWQLHVQPQAYQLYHSLVSQATSQDHRGV